MFQNVGIHFYVTSKLTITYTIVNLKYAIIQLKKLLLSYYHYNSYDCYELLN